MYEKLVAALNTADKRPCSYLKCPGSGECPTVGCLFREAADAIEELLKELERSKEYEAFWEKEANEALKKFQVAIASKPRWIPVAERLPEKPGNYLTAMGNGRIIENVFMMDDSDAWKSWHPHGKWYYNEAVWGGITHWMPLPTPPKEETE